MPLDMNSLLRSWSFSPLVPNPDTKTNPRSNLQACGLWNRAGLVVLMFLMISAKASAFSQTITFSGKNVALKTIFNEIRQQTGYVVFYDANVLKGARAVSINAQNMALENFFQLILKNQPLEYAIRNKTIVISKKSVNAPLQADKLNADLSAPIPITGKVVDREQKPIEGVTILIKNSTSGTSTGKDGSFSLSVPDGNAVLVISYVGYTTQEIAVGKRRSFPILLVEAVSDISEVVVVGYGKQKKSSVTGAIATVTSEDLTRTPVAQVSNMLAGRVPGLTAIQTSGLPGSDASSLSIRGFGSPLVLIDNVEGNLNNIDQNEIESITFLKDASAAVYGSRAGNGVILVTTKRGSSGAPVITYNHGSSFQSVTNMLKPASSGQTAQMIREEHLQSGKPEATARFTQEQVDLFYAGTDPDYPNTDWLSVLTRKHAPQHQNNVSVRGGNDKVKYYGFLGMLDQESMFKKNGGEYKRYNLRSNVDAQIAENLNFQVDLTHIVEDRHFPWRTDEYSNSVWADLWNTEPFYPATLPDPNKIPYANGGGTGGAHVTSNRDISGYKRTQSNSTIGSMSLEYKVKQLPGLSFKAFGNYRQDYSFYKTFERLVETWTYNHSSGNYTSLGGANNPKLTHVNSRSRVLTGQLYANYSKTFAQHHQVSAMALYEIIDYSTDNILASRDNYLTSAVDYLFAGGINGQKSDGSASEMGRKSTVGRFNYSFKNKYLLESTVRIDESAKFNAESRRGVFPSVSLGWRMNQESFMEQALRSFDELKLRVSYSKTGNDAVANFNYLSGYNFGSGYVFGNGANQSLLATSMANPRLSWETMTIYNAGFDFNVNNRKLYGSVDAFYRLREGIPGTRWNSLPSTFGANLPIENLNSVTDRGIEVIVGHRGQINEIKFDVSANINWNRSKWKNHDEPEYTDPDQRRMNKLSGRWTDVAFGYESDGLFGSQAEIDALHFVYNQDVGNAALRPGDVKYKDTNQDGLLDWKDQVQIGNGTFPRWTGGFNLNVSYKGFDVSALFQGAFFFYHYVTLKRGLGFPELMFNERWTAENNNTSALVPRLGGAGTNDNSSDYRYIASDYLRLKTLSVGYNVPKHLLSKVGVQNLRVFVSGLNLLTFSKLKKYGIDPEAPSGFGGYYYPQMKTMSFGVNLSF